jgi:hypothetical protein
VLEKKSCVKEGYENCHNGNKKDRTTYLLLHCCNTTLIQKKNEAKCATIPQK